MTERMNLNMEELEMVNGGSSGTDRYKCGEQKKTVIRKGTYVIDGQPHN